jgi:nucleoredoxin
MNSDLSLYGNKFLSKTGPVDDSALKGVKLIGIYFSAHWCPPCRMFTPQLIEFYNKVNENEKVFEVIFVTSDKSEDQFLEYYKDMPWLALEFNDPQKTEIKKAHSVSGIPTLVILKPDGTKLEVNGRGDVVKGVSAFEEWLKLTE